MVEGQAHHLGAQLAQVALHLLLPGLLDVVLGGVLQVRLDLWGGRRGKAGVGYSNVPQGQREGEAGRGV